MGRKEEELSLLLQAYQIDPLMENVNVNLGGYFQDEGLLRCVRECNGFRSLELWLYLFTVGILFHIPCGVVHQKALIFFYHTFQ